MRRTLVHFALIPMAAALAHLMSGCDAAELSEVPAPSAITAAVQVDREGDRPTAAEALDELRALHTTKEGAR